MKITIPEWIHIDSHTSIKGYRSLCVRCQQRYVGKLKDCYIWAEKHLEECEGFECEKCKHKYEGYLWDRCPKCGYCFNDIKLNNRKEINKKC